MQTRSSHQKRKDVSAHQGPGGGNQGPTTKRLKKTAGSAQQPATVPGDVDVNIVFFSCSGSNPCQSIEVSTELLQSPLSKCVPKFADFLQDFFSFTAVRDHTFEFYAVSLPFVSQLPRCLTLFSQRKKF